MSTLLKRLLQVAVPVSAVAVMSMGATGAFAGITNTKHYLGAGTAAGNNHVAASDSDEICVFCHTPHGGDTSIVGVPLWNKLLPAAGSYNTYTSSTMDATGTNAGAVSIGSVSLACLSCHDGTQAMDNILNAPGSGGFDATGGGTNGKAYTWSGTRVDANGKLQNASGFIAQLGTDLTNDHPIGIAYCGWSSKLAAAPAADIVPGDCADPDFKTATKVAGKQQWYVDTGTAGKQKTDMILYTRAFTAGGGSIAGDGPSVECASCHDPHTETVTFLRTVNTGSAVCLACHNK